MDFFLPLNQTSTIVIKEPLFKLENICLSFRDSPLFDNFNLEIFSGDKVCLSGASGSGKSTLLNILMGFQNVDKGTVYFKGQRMDDTITKNLRQETTWIPQESHLPIDSVSTLIYTPFAFNSNKSLKPQQKLIEETFLSLGLKRHTIDKDSTNLSGGEKQRLLIAVSLLLKKNIWFLDEPTSALDDFNKRKITDRLMGLDNVTIISASHDAYWLEKSSKIINL